MSQNTAGAGSRGSRPASLAEVDVRNAPPEIAAIYDELSRLSGIPLPALIWRHLATDPTALPAAWQALRPLFASGLLQEAAWRAVGRTLAGKFAGPDDNALRLAGLDPDVINAYRCVLQSYNRSNPVNFVSVRLLLAAMTKPVGTPTAVASMDRHWIPPAPIVGVVEMISVPAIPAEMRALIDGIAADPTIDRNLIVPSLYRHLVPWPTLLRRIHDDLVPRIPTGELPALTKQVAGALQQEADVLARHIGPLSGLAAIEGAADTLGRFSALIPEMIVIGYLLEHGLGGAQGRRKTF
jgi:hypothetical protein